MGVGRGKSCTSGEYITDMPLTKSKLYQNKVEQFPAPGATWTTLFNLSDGPKLVTRLWMATLAGGRLCPVRITFDGAAQPQIIGITGELFSSGFDIDVKFRNAFVGVSRGTSTAFSGFLNLLMPYYSSVKVEVYGGSTWWAQIQTRDFNSSDLEILGLKYGMQLYSNGYGLFGVKGRYTENTLLDVDGPAILAGLFLFLLNQNSNWLHLEGNIKIYYNSEVLAGFESSGTEDFFDSSWYFNEGPFSMNDEVLAAKSDVTFQTSSARFFPLYTAPYGSSHLKLTWNCGQAGQGDPITCYLRWISWYYK